MGRTYSRLGATLGSPKLLLLSLSSPSTPFPSVLPLPACCCVPRPLLDVRRSCPPPILFPFVTARTLGRSPPSQKRSRDPDCLSLNNVCNSRCILTRDSHLGGDIRSNFLNPSATTEYVEKTRH